MDMAGATGMGSSQVASLLKSSELGIMKKQISEMNQAKTQTANAALNMISGLPISPSQEGESSSSSWNASASVMGSARRIKDNIKPARLDHRGLLDTRPVTFNYKEGYGPGRQHTGFIADEMVSLGLQNVVVYTQKGEVKGLDYNAIVVHLVEMVKELNQRLVKLEGGEG
jgi:hypothetical protein